MLPIVIGPHIKSLEFPRWEIFELHGSNRIIFGLDYVAIYRPNSGNTVTYVDDVSQIFVEQEENVIKVSDFPILANYFKDDYVYFCLLYFLPDQLVVYDDKRLFYYIHYLANMEQAGYVVDKFNLLSITAVVENSNLYWIDLAIKPGEFNPSMFEKFRDVLIGYNSPLSSYLASIPTPQSFSSYFYECLNFASLQNLGNLVEKTISTDYVDVLDDDFEMNIFVDSVLYRTSEYPILTEAIRVLKIANTAIQPVVKATLTLLDKRSEALDPEVTTVGELFSIQQGYVSTEESLDIEESLNTEETVKTYPYPEEFIKIWKITKYFFSSN